MLTAPAAATSSRPGVSAKLSCGETIYRMREMRLSTSVVVGFVFVRYSSLMEMNPLPGGRPKRGEAMKVLS